MRKKFSRIKLNGDCVLRMKLPAGSVEIQKSLITSYERTVQVTPVQTEEDYSVLRL